MLAQRAAGVRPGLFTQMCSVQRMQSAAQRLHGARGLVDGDAQFFHLRLGAGTGAAVPLRVIFRAAHAGQIFIAGGKKAAACHLQHRGGVDVDMLGVRFQRDLISGAALRSGEHLGALEHGYILLRDEAAGCVHHALNIGKAAACGLGGPFGAVIVAVENDAAVGVPGLSHDFPHHGGNIVRTFQFVGKIVQHVGHNSVCHRIGKADALARTHHAEFKFIASESERRGAIAVGIIQL